MDADLDTLATALHARTDDLLKGSPDRLPWRPAVGIAPRISDAEIVTLAVMQALLGFTSEARWLRYAADHLRHLFATTRALDGPASDEGADVASGMALDRRDGPMDRPALAPRNLPAADRRRWHRHQVHRTASRHSDRSARLPARRRPNRHLGPPLGICQQIRLRSKPRYVRLRILDPAAWPDSRPFSELTVRIDELAAAPPAASTIFIVENEITYLAFPPVHDAIVVFGSGYALSSLAALTWLADHSLVYWGDIDTHGMSILNQLRAAFPHVRSILMDRATLLAHRSQWVPEVSGINAHLDRLSADEADLYHDLVEDALGPAVRLEQERVRSSAIVAAIASDAAAVTGPAR